MPLRFRLLEFFFSKGNWGEESFQNKKTGPFEPAENL